MTLAVQILSGALLAAGCFFSLVGAIGLNRLPDFYTRSHACGMTDTMGAGLILAGLMVYALYPLQIAVLIKLVAVLIFLLVTSPISSHAVTRAAWQSGLMPRLAGDLPEGVAPSSAKGVDPVVSAPASDEEAP